MKMNEVQRQTSSRMAPAMPPEAVDIQGIVHADRVERHRDQPALVGEERHAEIADRDLEREERRADDRAEGPRSRCARLTSQAARNPRTSSIGTDTTT